MCHLQLRTVVFVAWVVAYVAFLHSIRRMWSGRYVRSPLVRSLFLNMVNDSEAAAAAETHEVRFIDNPILTRSDYLPVLTE